MKVMSRKNRFIRRRISRHCSLRGTGSGEEKRRKKRRKETRRGNGGIGRRKISSVRIFRSGSVEQTETAEEGRLPRLTLRDNVAANGANLHTRSTHTRDLIRFFTVARYLFVDREEKWRRVSPVVEFRSRYTDKWFCFSGEWKRIIRSKGLLIRRIIIIFRANKKDNPILKRF